MTEPAVRWPEHRSWRTRHDRVAFITLPGATEEVRVRRRTLRLDGTQKIAAWVCDSCGPMSEPTCAHALAMVRSGLDNAPGPPLPLDDRGHT